MNSSNLINMCCYNIFDIKNRLKYVISPCTFMRFWDWSLHFFLFGISFSTL